ncbi:hypothetical protein MTO96_021342 [Rhipicephalus appendiculatus]
MAAAVPFMLSLLLTQVNGASARQCSRKAAAFLPPEGATTQGLRATTPKTTVAPDDDSEMTSPDVPVSGACAIPASETPCDYRLDDNGQLHKSGFFSASVGRETGMAAAVPFMLFLLLTQVNGASARQCSRKAAAFLPPEGATTQGLRATTPKTTVAPDDDSEMTSPDVPVSGACAIPASETPCDYRLDDNGQLHKSGFFSASVGRETGMAAAVPFMLFLLLTQVNGTSARQCSRKAAAFLPPEGSHNARTTSDNP